MNITIDEEDLEDGFTINKLLQYVLKETIDEKKFILIDYY
jgi:hypothetical protein